MSEEIQIRGPRLLLRPFRPAEIEAEWRAMVTADPMTIGVLPEQAAFTERLRRSGRLVDGWLDLAIDIGGEAAGRIQTFVPPGRALPPATFDIGIGLRENARGQGYGSEALALLAGWLFTHAGAAVLEAPTDAANVAMRAVLRRSGWAQDGTLAEAGREWVMYRLTRQQWQAQSAPA